MKYLFITEIPTLNPLLDFDIGGHNIDLHNNFDCQLLRQENNTLEIYFKKNRGDLHYDETNAVILFSNILEFESSFLISEANKATTLINFAKGELLENSKYYDNKSVNYFFIEFDEGQYIDIFCKEAIVILW